MWAVCSLPSASWASSTYSQANMEHPAGWVSVNLEGVTVEMGAIFKEGTGGGGAVEGVAVFGFEL